MQRKAKIVAALLGGVSAMPVLYACATVPETQEYVTCSDNDADTSNDCPETTLPVEVE